MSFFSLITLELFLTIAAELWLRRCIDLRDAVFRNVARHFTVRLAEKLAHYRGGPHMRSLISIDFPAPEMEPESAHVVSAVSVP